MKTKKIIKKTGIFIAVLLMFTLLFSGKQKTKEQSSNDLTIVSQDTHVLVTVNTDSLNSSNLNSKVILSDDRSDPSENPGNPSEFVSIVDKNQKIYWSGVASDPNSTDVINILEIYRKTDGGAEILDKTFKDPDKNGVVVGKIKDKKVDGLEYYNIRIMVNQDSTKIFDIDPKLKMTTN